MLERHWRGKHALARRREGRACAWRGVGVLGRLAREDLLREACCVGERQVGGGCCRHEEAHTSYWLCGRALREAPVEQWAGLRCVDGHEGVSVMGEREDVMVGPSFPVQMTICKRAIAR
ncbi:unnamed protein product, partial [Dovyalis caffra]